MKLLTLAVLLLSVAALLAPHANAELITMGAIAAVAGYCAKYGCSVSVGKRDTLGISGDKGGEGWMLKRHVHQAFNGIDADSDGKITKREAEAVLGTELTSRLWNSNDRNGDGLIERHEFVPSP